MLIPKAHATVYDVQLCACGQIYLYIYALAQSPIPLRLSVIYLLRRPVRKHWQVSGIDAALG